MESGIETVLHDGAQIAIIVRRRFSSTGIEFFTPDDYSQQLAYMNRPEKYVIPPHVHNEVYRDVSTTQEVLFVRSGKLRVDLYNDKKEYIESRLLFAGDVILLASGGHGFEMIENCEILEVKQGPYAGDADKTRFTPHDNSAVVVRGFQGE